MTRLGFRWYPLIAGVLIVVVFELALILWTTHGNFTYTLDDPYIHLALSENLARFGHYGINVEEYSSASSSIIWPLLLVPFFAIGIGPYGPIVLNIPLAIVTALVLHRTIESAAEAHGGEIARISWAWALLALLAVNGFGVIFMGMEHSLHILVTVSIMYFVNRMRLAADGGRKIQNGYDDILLVLCILLSPLIRFEGLAISAFAIAMLAAMGRVRLAILSAALIALALALYFYAMNTMGLPWLPSSVLVKSAAAADTAAQTDLAAKLLSAISHAGSNAIANLQNPEAILLLLLTLLIGLQALRAWYVGERLSPVYVAGGLVVVGLHMAFGNFGWYGRYQSYVFAFAICFALYVFSPLFRWVAALSYKRQEQLAVVGIFCVLAVLVRFGLSQVFMPVITTPIAALNIYEQQRQMHEFATRHWKAPVAVNDIGYVAFQNDEYVLDLWGLGSEEARRLRQSGDRDMLRKLTEKHDVHLAMIYEESFSQDIPADWQKVAELGLSAQSIFASDRVAFFVFGLGQAGCLRVADQLMEFARTLARPKNLTVDRGACERLEISRDRKRQRATDS